MSLKDLTQKISSLNFNHTYVGAISDSGVEIVIYASEDTYVEIELIEETTGIFSFNCNLCYFYYDDSWDVNYKAPYHQFTISNSVLTDTKIQRSVCTVKDLRLLMDMLYLKEYKTTKETKLDLLEKLIIDFRGLLGNILSDVELIDLKESYEALEGVEDDLFPLNAGKILSDLEVRYTKVCQNSVIPLLKNIPDVEV